MARTPQSPKPGADVEPAALRLATALCAILHDGAPYAPGEPVPVDREAHDGLVQAGAVADGEFDALPVAAA